MRHRYRASNDSLYRCYPADDADLPGKARLVPTEDNYVALWAALVESRLYSRLVMAREAGSSQEERSANSNDSTSGQPETTSLMRRP